MSGVDELRSAAAAVLSSLDEAASSVAQASAEAGSLAESAAGHGWAGVAQAMTGAQEALSPLPAAVDGLCESVTGVVRELDAVPAEAGSDEVAHRLGAAAARLDEVRRGVDAALEQVSGARSEAEPADATSVLTLLDDAEEHLRAAERRAAAATSATEVEQSEASRWGNPQGATAPRHRRPDPRKRHRPRTPQNQAPWAASSSPGCTTRKGTSHRRSGRSPNVWPGTA